MKNRVIGAPLGVVPGDRDSYLVYNRLRQSRFLADRELLSVAVLLDSLAPPEVHAESLAKGTLAHLESRDVLRLINRATEAGLTATETEVIGALHRNDSQIKPAEISSVCWITKNRPGELRASLEGWADQLRKFGRSPERRLFEDGDAAHKLGPEARTFDRTGAERLVRHLTEQGVPEGVARFAFFGDGGAIYNNASPAYGANRNRCLALTAGEAILMLDDDVSCKLKAHQARLAVPVLSEHVDPTHIYYYSDDSEDFSNPDFVDVDDADPLALHEAYLSQTAGAVYQSKGLDLSTLNRSLLGSALERPKRCKVTQAGHFGASGSRFRSRLLHLAGSIRKYHDSDELFLKGTTGTRCHRWVDRPVLSAGSAIFSMIMAVDNSAVTPPFLPVGRGDEWVWSTAFQACDPIYIAYLPQMVYHRGAPGSGGELVPVAEYRFSVTECFRHLVALWEPSEADKADPRHALRSLGAHLSEAGRSSWSEFIELMTSAWIREAESTRDRIDDLLVWFDHTPTAWSEAAGRFLESMEGYFGGPEFGVPFDLPIKQESYTPPATTSEDWRHGALLQLVRDYGNLLEWWGEIWGLCRQYNAE